MSLDKLTTLCEKINEEFKMVWPSARPSAYFTAIVIAELSLLAAAKNFAEYNNVVNDDSDEKEVRKVDGPFSGTSLTIDKHFDTESIQRYTLRSCKTYGDSDRDGNVDILVMSKKTLFGVSFQTLHRDRDFEDNQELFKQADRDFRAQIKRFKPYVGRRG